MRFLARRILEWAHQGFLGRADRACYYLLGTHMDARREPDYYAILQVDRHAHPLVITRVYRLLDVRRNRPSQPDLPLMVLGELLGCSVGEAQFTLWYLRGKRLIEQTDDGWAITVAGVDCVDANHGDRRRTRRLGVALPSLPRPCEPLPAGITPHRRVRPH